MSDELIIEGKNTESIRIDCVLLSVSSTELSGAIRNTYVGSPVD